MGSCVSFFNCLRAFGWCIVSLISGDYASLLHDQSGWITPFDLDTNGLYDPSQKSTWIILQRPRSVIVVKVIEMDIEYHAWCAFDFLQVS